MASIIKVDPQRLRSAAGQLQSTSAQITSATNSMAQTVGTLSGAVWSGDAATAYLNKFNGLSDEIKKIDTMVKEHTDDLQKMANEYERAESANQQSANALNDSIF